MAVWIGIDNVWFNPEQTRTTRVAIDEFFEEGGCAICQRSPLASAVDGGAQVEPDTSEEKSSYQATKSAEQKQDKHLTIP